MSTPIPAPRYPAGRFREHCRPESSAGEAFRDDVLIPALRDNVRVSVDLSDCLGVPPSWSEEVFGGLVRKLGVSVLSRITVIDNREGCDSATEAMKFMEEQAERQ